MNPSNGSYIYSLTTHGAVASVTCDPGYTANVSSVTCLDSGNWSDYLTCERIG